MARPVLVALVAVLVWSGIATPAASAAGALTVTLRMPQLPSNGLVDMKTVEQATVTVTDETGAAVPGAVAQQAQGCAWWSEATAGSDGVITLPVTVDCAASVTVTVNDPSSGASGTSNAVAVAVRKLANPTLTLATPPPYGAGQTITGTIRAVDQVGNPFVKAYVPAADDGCVSWGQASADGTGLISVPLTLHCSESTLSLPVYAQSDDGSVTDDNTFTPRVQITLSPPPTPVVQLPGPGPFAYGQTVNATIKMTNAAGGPISGASVSSNTDLGGCGSWPAATSGADGIITLPITITCNLDTVFIVSTPDNGTLITPDTHIGVFAPISLAAPSTTVKRPYYVVTLAPHMPASVRAFANHLYIQTSQDQTTWRTTVDLAGYGSPQVPNVWFAKPGAAYARLVYLGNGQFDTTLSNVATLHVQSGTVPAWLAQFNHYRAVAGLAPVGEDPHFDAADAAHVRYMEKTGQFGHNENPKSKYYSSLGNYGGTSSVLYAGLRPSAVIPGWLSTPYHQMGMLQPTLYTTGFATDGRYSALFVFGGSQVPSTSASAVPRQPGTSVWPRPGGQMPLHVFPGFESPDPLVHCSGTYRRAAANGGIGGALLAMMPSPAKTTTPSAALYDNGVRVPACVFGDTYTAPNYVINYLVHMLPLAKQRTGHHYKAVVHEAGRTLTWSFTG